MFDKKRQLKWFGHVSRMDEKRWAKKLLTIPATGRRPIGRPPKKFFDNINSTIMSKIPRTSNEITVSEALELAQDKEWCRRLCNSLVTQRIEQATQINA